MYLTKHIRRNYDISHGTNDFQTIAQMQWTACHITQK